VLERREAYVLIELVGVAAEIATEDQERLSDPAA
jgi:hypothetical protein